MQITNMKIVKLFSEWSILERILTIIGVCTSLFAIVIGSGIFIFDLWTYKIIIIMAVLLMGYLPTIIVKKGEKTISKWIGLVFLLMGISSLVYLINQIPRLIMSYGSSWTNFDIIFGTMFILSILELTRRCFGPIMPAIGGFFLLYVIFGNHLPPNFFGHTGFSFERTISYMYGPAAIFGEIMTVFVNVVFIYLLFGAFLQYSGATEFFINFASSVAGKWRGGPAKIAVLSSALLGSINGNAVANVATTGAITIPLMKKTGYKPYFAGAVEAVASTGGQFLPPIMGAAAFIMAELLSISYAEVIVAATIPALLYFVSCLLMVDLEAVRLGLKGMDSKDIPDLKDVMKKGGHLLIPIIVLVYELIFIRMSVSRAGLIASGLLIAISSIRKETRMDLSKIIKALSEGARSSIGIAAVIATAGLIVGAVGMTGLGMRFSSVVLAVAQDNFYLVALLTALICIVLGMGLPTTAAYIISVSVASSTMLRIGVAPLAAHMFVFYYAALSTITPPVAASSYTAAAIAQSPIMKTSIYATMLGLAGFVVPFLFITSPALLMQGGVSSILCTSFTAVIGLAAVAMALEGVAFAGKIKWNLFQRILFAISFLGLIIPGTSTDLFGGILFIIAILFSKDVWKKILRRDYVEN